MKYLLRLKASERAGQVEAAWGTMRPMASTMSSALRVRVEPGLLDALDAAAAHMKRPGEKLTRSDAARLLLWEILQAKGIIPAETTAEGFFSRIGPKEAGQQAEPAGVTASGRMVFIAGKL